MPVCTMYVSNNIISTMIEGINFMAERSRQRLSFPAQNEGEICSVCNIKHSTSCPVMKTQQIMTQTVANMEEDWNSVASIQYEFL